MDSVIRIRGTYPDIQFHDRGGYQSRHKATLALLIDMFGRYGAQFQGRHFDFFIASFDNPESANDLADKVPYVLSYSVTPQCRPNILAMPDFIFGGWPEIGITSYDQVTQDILAAGNAPPDTDKLFWIGSIPTHESRQTLLDIAQQHPEDMLVVPMQWQATSAPSAGRLPANHYVSMPDHARYAMLIDVRGAGYSGRLKLLMFANRPVFIAERRFEEFYFPHLKAWEHFVPVRDDLSDLIEKMGQIKADPVLARQLGQNAVNFARQYLTRDYALSYLRDLLLRISTG